MCYPELGDHSDVARVQVLDRELLLAPQELQSPQPLLLPPVLIPNPAVRAQHTRENAQIGEPPHEWIRGGFPHIGRECAGVGPLNFDRFTFAFSASPHTIHRRRKELHDRFQKGNGSDPRRPGGGKNRHKGSRPDCLSKAKRDLIGGQFLALQILFKQGIVPFGGGLDQGCARLLCCIGQVFRDSLLRFALLRPRHHFKQIDDALKCLFLAPGELDRDKGHLC